LFRDNLMTDPRWVLQLCHNYKAPFLDMARQYTSLFAGTDYRVLTLFLCGEPDEQVVVGAASDEVLFLELKSADLDGLKWGIIKNIAALHQQRNFLFAIAHRNKPVYICTHLPDLPVVGVYHAFGAFDRLGRRLYARWRRKRLALLLGVSDAVRDNLRMALPSFPPVQIQTLYNRIDPTRLRELQYPAAEARERLGLATEDFVIANVGRLHQDKDQDTLLRAFARCVDQLPQAILLIIGIGRLESKLKREAEKLRIQDRVRFTGAVAEAPRYFRAFDLFVLSSDCEPFGMVLLEAMAAGVPLIATRSGGAQEVVADTGGLFDVGNDQALADLMIKFHAMSPAVREELIQAMDQRLHQYFTDAAVKAQFWSLPPIRELVAGKVK
jgi:glycosyltransferase involved in cell wall biosynthesis